MIFARSPDPEILDHAVFIETTNGKLGLRSAKQLLVQIDNAPDDADDRNDQTADFMVVTKGNTMSPPGGASVGW